MAKEVVKDPRQVGLDPFYLPYPLPERPITAAELAERLSVKGQHGDFLLRQMLKGLERVEPRDRFGYPIPMTKDQINSWRKHEFNKLRCALESIEKAIPILKEA